MFKDLEKESILASMDKEEIEALKAYYESIAVQPEPSDEQDLEESVKNKTDDEDFTAAFDNVQW